MANVDDHHHHHHIFPLNMNNLNFKHYVYPFTLTSISNESEYIPDRQSTCIILYSIYFRCLGILCIFFLPMFIRIISIDETMWQYMGEREKKCEMNSFSIKTGKNNNIVIRVLSIEI